MTEPVTPVNERAVLALERIARQLELISVSLDEVQCAVDDGHEWMRLESGCDEHGSKWCRECETCGSHKVGI